MGLLLDSSRTFIGSSINDQCFNCVCSGDQRNGDVIESCDIEYNDIHPGNSDSKAAAADPGPAVNGDGGGEASPTKVEENGIIHDVEQRLIINDGKSENFTLDNTTTTTTSQTCNSGVSDVSANNNRNSVELKVNWALRVWILFIFFPSQ